jgi:hypothetical protein
MPDGLVIPGGPGFSGHPQPPDVPCDPTGDAWRGEPGAPGPPGPAGPPGSFGGGEAPVDGFAYGRVNAVWQKVVPLTQLGMAVGQVPVWVAYEGSSIPGMVIPGSGHQGIAFERLVTSSTDLADILIQRKTAVSGGTATNVNATVRIDSITGVADRNQNPSLLIINTSNSTVGSVNPALWVQSIKAPGSNAKVWAEVVNTNDQTGQPSSFGTGQVTSELAVLCNKLDDQPNNNTFGGVGARKVLHVLATRSNEGDATRNEVSTGIWIGTTAVSGQADTLTNYQQAIGIINNSQIRQVLDTRGAIPVTGSPDPVAAVRMSAGHIIDLHGGPALNSPPGDYLWYDTATSKLKFNHGATTVWSIDASGNVRAAGTITGSVTP